MSPVEKAFATGLSRELSPAWNRFVTVYGALITLGVVISAILGKPGLYVLTAIFLGAMLVLVFVTIGTSVETAETRVPAYDLAMAALSVACGIYFWLNADYVSNRISLLDLLSPADVFFGASFLLLTLEASRRTTGIGLTGFVVLVLLYNLFGDGLPGVFGHGPIDHQHFLDLMVFTTEGIFGAPLRVAATFPSSSCSLAPCSMPRERAPSSSVWRRPSPAAPPAARPRPALSRQACSAPSPAIRWPTW